MSEWIDVTDKVMGTAWRGAWFVYDYDHHPYPIGLHDNELDALRQVVGQGYGKVVFWVFGREWDEVKP